MHQARKTMAAGICLSNVSCIRTSHRTFVLRLKSWKQTLIKCWMLARELQCPPTYLFTYACILAAYTLILTIPSQCGALCSTFYIYHLMRCVVYCSLCTPPPQDYGRAVCVCVCITNSSLFIFYFSYLWFCCFCAHRSSACFLVGGACLPPVCSHRIRAPIFYRPSSCITPNI